MKKIFYIVLVLFIAQACSGIDESSESKSSTDTKTSAEENSEKDIKKEKNECSLDELLAMLYFDHERFDSYVLKKGYNFDNSEIKDISGDATVYSYLGKENIYDLSESFVFRLIKFSDFVREDHWALAHFTYKTAENNEYVEFKRQLKQNGFVYTGSRMPNESSMFLIYEKGKIDILLESSKIDIDGETKNMYQIELILHRIHQ